MSAASVVTFEGPAVKVERPEAAETASSAETAVLEMIRSRFEGETKKAAKELLLPVPAEEGERVAFTFDAEFQTRIAALTLRDAIFLRSTAHLLKPEYFENAAEASVVGLALKHFATYQSLPAKTTINELIRAGAKDKTLRKELVPQIVDFYKQVYGSDAIDLSDAEYVKVQVAEFARHQAVSAAILKSVDLLDKKDFPKILALIQNAASVGLMADMQGYDYFEEIKSRTLERDEKAAGLRPPTGITTGTVAIDDLLYHKGWGRKELAVILGGAKAGKTTALINFARAASFAGYRVLYVTLEVLSRIASERLDASIGEFLMSELDSKHKDVEKAIADAATRAGKIIMHEFPSGTMTANDLRGVLDYHRGKGMTFDLIVVDYADLMAPVNRTDDPRENSRTVYVDLRAIAFEQDAAMLTATQTNREGFKATVARAEHVAEDFNKIRTADVVISINSTDEEKAANEARLFFAASRNQKQMMTVFVQQDLERMRFILKVLRIE